MGNRHWVTAVVGGQYGSEGKGVVVAELADYNDVFIRTGGPNAGHSIIHHGKKWAMQMLPCGWINQDATLILGPGAVVSIDILNAEVAAIEKVHGINVSNRLYIDSRATILLHDHAVEEGHTDGRIHQRIGSTGEGVGAARRAKLMRGQEMCKLARDMGSEINGIVADTVTLLRHMSPRRVLLEGTQGYGLSLHLGQWPYVTSHMCTAPQLAADAGLPGVDTCWMVVRTFPIRVAGNSGPLHNETTWEAVSKHCGREVIEKTTVTKKIRRVGLWDSRMVQEAAYVNGAHFISLNFADYLHKDMQYVTEWESVPEQVKDHLLEVDQLTQADLAFVGTGFSEGTGWTYVRMPKYKPSDS